MRSTFLLACVLALGACAQPIRQHDYRVTIEADNDVMITGRCDYVQEGKPTWRKIGPGSATDAFTLYSSRDVTCRFDKITVTLKPLRANLAILNGAIISSAETTDQSITLTAP